MIDLTPLEVRKKKGDFRKAMRGYDPALVDDFLDVTADRMEELVRENMTFADRVSRLEVLVADYREREKALTEALVSAQEMREETRRQATRDADLLRREAEAEAADIRAAAHQAKEKEEDGLRRLRAQRSQLMKSFRAFLERELAELSVAEEALGLRRSRGRGRNASSMTADLFAEADDSDLDDDDALAYDAQESLPSGPELVIGSPRRPSRSRRSPKPVRETLADESAIKDASLNGDEEAYDVAEFAPADEPVVKTRPPVMLLKDSDTVSNAGLFADALDGTLPGEEKTSRHHERAKPTSLAALEEEVMRELREQPHSAEKAALLSSVLEEDV